MVSSLKQAQSKEPCTTRTASFLNAFLAGEGCLLRLTHSALPSCWCDVLHHVDWNLHSAQLLVLCASTFLTISVLQMGAAAGQTKKGKYILRCTPIGAVLRQIGVEHVDFWSLDVEGAEVRCMVRT